MAALFVAGLTLSVDGRVGAQGPAAEPPATPTGLTGAFTHESVSLSWDDPGDPSITGYQILRRERGVHEVGVFLIHVDDTNSAATSYVDTAVEAEASYVYRVKARNSSGLSERSRFFRADLPAAPDPPAPGRPDPPTHLTAEAAGETQIDLSWTAPEHTNGSAIVGYRIEVSTDRGTSWNDLIADTGSTGATYAHTGLVSGATRHYRTSAINSVGAGAPSNIASATTDDLTPPRFVAGVVGADGDSLELYFSEPLDLDPGRTPRASSFGVTADGAPIAVGAVEVIRGARAVRLSDRSEPRDPAGADSQRELHRSHRRERRGCHAGPCRQRRSVADRPARHEWLHPHRRQHARRPSAGCGHATSHSHSHRSNRSDTGCESAADAGTAQGEFGTPGCNWEPATPRGARGRKGAARRVGRLASAAGGGKQATTGTLVARLGPPAAGGHGWRG